MLRIGIIGTGGMAGDHAKNFKKIRGVKLVACCDLRKERCMSFAEKWKIPAVYTDYKELLKNEKLNGLSIVTPDAVHAEISIAALNKGIAVLCEKPMATTLKDARRMLNASRRKGIIAMINFSKRNAFCVQEAHDFISRGGIGDIRHVEASYLQSWLVVDDLGDWRTKSTLTWRLSTRHGSAGVLGDLGCHIYDVAGFLCSDIDEIACRLKTFDKGVHSNKIGEYVLDANDSFVSTVVFKNGAIGTIHSSRWATGYLDRVFIRVHGDGGAIDIDFNRSMNNYLLFTAKKKKWELIKCKSTLNNYERFVRAIKTGKKDMSDFENGVKVQAYLHYSFLSDTKKRALKVKS